MTIIGSTGAPISPLSVSLPGEPVPVPKMATAPAPAPAAAAAAPSAEAAPSETEQAVHKLFAQMIGAEYMKGAASMQEAFNKGEQQRQKDGHALIKRAAEMGKDE